MYWYQWITMYAMIIAFFSMGIFIEAEIGWWFVPTCILVIVGGVLVVKFTPEKLDTKETEMFAYWENKREEERRSRI